MDRTLIYAKPSAIDVKPYSFVASPVLTSQKTTVTLQVKGPYNLRNLYLSASDIKIYNGLNYSYFNPFSSINHLKDKNPGFTGMVIPFFNLVNDSYVVFDIPNQLFFYVNQLDPNIPYNSYLDIIIENEAGYGLLSRDSYTYSVSSWSGFFQEQKPCIKGILISNTF